MPGNFIDSNVLIYLASADSEKAEQAEAILRSGGAISVQVLNEIAHVARRKMRLSWQETRVFLSLVRGLLPVHALTAESQERGMELAERYGLSVYDGMIVASALLAGSEILWSEDMQDALLVEGTLRISNPFRRLK